MRSYYGNLPHLLGRVTAQAVHGLYAVFVAKQPGSDTVNVCSEVVGTRKCVLAPGWGVWGNVIVSAG